MLIKKEKEGSIIVYHVDKEYDDVKLEKVLNTFVKPQHIKMIIDEDADVYNKEGVLLLKFRKNALNIDAHIQAFYDNIIKFAKTTSSNRGNATGSKNRNLASNPKVMSNIFGYFDR
jgi:hypothetical protein